MSIKKNLVRGLAAAATIGAMSAGALLVAAPANAAESERWVGPIAHTNAGADAYTWAVPGVSGDITSTTVNVDVLAYQAMIAAGGVPMFSMPGIGAPGPIIDKASGRCLTKTDEPFAASTLLACDASNPKQQFEMVSYANDAEFFALRSSADHTYLRLQANGLFSTPGFPVTMGAATFAMLGFTAEVVTPPAVADLTVTSPGELETVGSSNVVFTGTGEPGAAIEITDADGVLIGSTTVGADGSWSVTVPTLPEGVTSVVVSSGDQSLAVTFVVTSDSEDTPIMALAGVGALGLFAAGGAGLVVRRRRNTAG